LTSFNGAAVHDRGEMGDTIGLNVLTGWLQWGRG
jgi:hypothetical protein